MRTVIKVENVSKQYRLGKIDAGSLSHDIRRWWSGVVGKEDPYLKVGEANDRTVKGSSEYVWALRDINFEVKEGEVLGIIGRNGAGKSTLLKILSRTTSPTTGSLKVRGRIASLLEVGTGFHPELTGRENIFLNGAILGMKKKEVTSKFDEIVDFSGVERYIDTPVKRYSSGMYVRLAFAVAAFLDPEVLIVDEVLAVGDYDFQKKCLGKMKNVTGDGRTVLFVSHSMAAVRQLCDKAMLLANGSVERAGQVDEIIRHYFQRGDQIGEKRSLEPYRVYNINNSPLYILDIFVAGSESHFPTIPLGEEPEIAIGIISRMKVVDANITIALYNSEGIKIGLAFSWDDNFYLNTEEGTYTIFFKLNGIKLTPGEYFIGVGINQSAHSVAWDGVSLYPIFKVEDQNNIKHFSHRPWGISHLIGNSWKISKHNTKKNDPV